MGIDDNYYQLVKRIKFLRQKKYKNVNDLLEIMELENKIEGYEAEKKIKKKRKVKGNGRQENKR